MQSTIMKTPSAIADTAKNTKIPNKYNYKAIVRLRPISLAKAAS